ncbi:MAG: riboflavin synthase [Hydrogenophilus sp.]|nr:riboflavin synthase [Hydrogenophilus sp.]
MFTGIVLGVGRVERVIPQRDGVRVAVVSQAVSGEGVEIGESIAVHGVCLTVVGCERGTEGWRFWFDVSGETLRCTIGLAEEGKEVNLERALRVGDPVGGHWVSGHVDAVGEVSEVEERGESVRVVFTVPSTVAPFVARKGSVAINGVSLTINEVEDLADGRCRMAVNVIPHTQAVTTFATVRVGERVNVEVDLLARYLLRWLERDPQGGGEKERET